MVQVPICSRKALAPFGQLTATSRCDHLLLEWRIALELVRSKDLCGIFPVLAGDRMYSRHFLGSEGAATRTTSWMQQLLQRPVAEEEDDSGIGEIFGDFFKQRPKTLPECAGDVVVAAIEQSVKGALEHGGARCVPGTVSAAAAAPASDWEGTAPVAVRKVLAEVLTYQGTLLRGVPDDAIEKVVADIAKAV